MKSGHRRPPANLPFVEHPVTRVGPVVAHVTTVYRIKLGNTEPKVQAVIRTTGALGWTRAFPDQHHVLLHAVSVVAILNGGVLYAAVANPGFPPAHNREMRTRLTASHPLRRAPGHEQQHAPHLTDADRLADQWIGQLLRPNATRPVIVAGRQPARS